MKRLPLLCVLSLSLLLPIELAAQSAAFRAQGRYYSAKEAYEAGKFAEAAQKCRESREFLEGRTNLRLQYLMVTALFRSGQFSEAQKEMDRFFQIDGHDKDSGQWKDRERLYREFPQEVDKLTADETKEMSKMIDKIDEKVSSGAEAKALAAQQVENEVAILLAKATDSPPNHTEDDDAILLEGTPDRLVYTLTRRLAHGKVFMVCQTSFGVNDISKATVEDGKLYLYFSRSMRMRMRWEKVDPRIQTSDPTDYNVTYLPVTFRGSEAEMLELMQRLLKARDARRK